VRACRFDIPAPDGSLSPCVFELSHLVRYISTRGNLHAYSHVKHPVFNATINRVDALDYISLVSAEEQEQIHRERRRLGLSMEESHPLTDADWVRYNRMRRDLGATGRTLREEEVFVDLVNDVEERGNESDSDESLLASFGLGDHFRVRNPHLLNRNASQDTETSARNSSTTNRGEETNNSQNGSTETRRTDPSLPSRSQLGSFILNGAIRSPRHEAGLIGIMQLANQGGLTETIGYGHRADWFANNIDAMFRADGPLGSYTQVSAAVLLRHFRQAETAARTLYNRAHSNDRTGAGHEDIPNWAQEFFRYFEATANQDRPGARSNRIRSERASVAASLTGRQGPLGYQGSGPATLRTETAPNVGRPEMRQRTIGAVSSTRTRVGDDTDEPGNVEGRDDVRQRRQAPRRNRSGTRRRNVHVNGGSFNPEVNDPEARFGGIAYGYNSLNTLTQGIAQMISGFERRAPIEIVNNYAETSQLLAGARNPQDIAFYNRALDFFRYEMSSFHSNGTNETTTETDRENDAD